MAITYVNDLRLSEMGTGDNSGTWGTVTNTNLELIGEALGFGTEAITTNADTHTSTIADGSTDPVRAMYVKYTGTLDSACTITIGPNTVNKFYYIENATSGSQNIIISQGSGANVTIPAGDVKAVYLDGAGSGAAVVDAFASLSVVDLKVQDDLTVSDDLAVTGLATIGETLAVTGVLTTTAATVFNGGFASNADSTMGTDKKLIFRDSAIHISSTADGDLSIAADDEIDITSTLIDINGNLEVSGTTAFANSITLTATAMNIDFMETGVSDSNHRIRQNSGNLSFGKLSDDGGTFTENMLLDGGAGTIFNNGGAPAFDFRIEGDTLPNLFHVDAGEDSLGINTVGVAGSLVTLQGKAGSDGSPITTKTLHLIEGGYNNGNTFQVSDASSVSRFAVNGYGSSSVGGDTTLAQWFNADGTYGTKFQVQTLGDDTDQNYVTAAFIKSRNDTSPSYVVIGKNRGGAFNSDTTINGSDSIGAISFQGADGTTYQEAGRISSEAESGWGANDGEARLEFYTNAGTTSVSKKMTIESGGNVTIEDGDLVIGTSGHGIDFSATGDATGGASISEVLDDYEEGYVGITITCSGGGTITLDSGGDSAYYTKIGRLVTVGGRLEVSSVSSPTGHIYIRGFPYTALFDREAAGQNTASGIVYNPASDLDGQLAIEMTNTYTTSLLVRQGGGQAAGVTTMADKIDGDSLIAFTVTYVAA